MTNSRKILITGAAGVIGGLIGSIFILPLLVQLNFLSTATILNRFALQNQTAITHIKEKPVFIPQPNYFSDAIDKIEPSIATVQSFTGGQLVRSGSGVFITQDGLVATLNSLVPLSTEVIQIANAGKIYKAKIAFRNYSQNISIISITAGNNLQVVQFKKELPALGQKLMVFGKNTNFGRDVSSVAEALVSQISEAGGQFKISTQYDSGFYGAAIIDNEGAVLGLLDYKSQKPTIIYFDAISKTLEKYLTVSQKK